MSISYHVYSNLGMGDPINYRSPIATVNGLSWKSTALFFPSEWKFAVRAFDPVTGLEEANIDASVEVDLGPLGTDISYLPNSPAGLVALPRPSGSIRVEWTYSFSGVANAPQGFHVYAGIGSVSYLTPLATIPARGDLMGRYATTLTGLTVGNTYAVGVRAYNAVGEESNTYAVNCILKPAGPIAVVGLTSVATGVS